MRFLIILSLAALPACDVQNSDTGNTVTVTYDKQEIRRKAREAGRAARDVAVGTGNIAASTGRAIKREVGDIDVEVRRTRTDKAE